MENLFATDYGICANDEKCCSSLTVQGFFFNTNNTSDREKDTIHINLTE